MSEEQIHAARAALERIGYPADLVRAGYEFSDLAAGHGDLRAIDIAAFGQRPPSYRSACVGVSFGDEAPSYFRMLGAPIVLKVGAEHIAEYTYSRDLQPIRVQQHASSNLVDLVQERADSWAPGRVLSAKALTENKHERQLDFYDAGFLPAIEQVVQRKLDTLLREVLTLVSQSQRASTQQVYRLVFRLLAAKVLRDKGARITESLEDPRELLDGVARHYGIHSQLNVPKTLLTEAWQLIFSSVNFHNLAVDDLAYIYETTFVSAEARERLGIHATPPGMAEYMLRALPIEDIPAQRRRVFEPFAGHAVFLVASLRRLRELLPAEMSNAQRHRYLVQRLHGIEKDEFAHEVAMLSLLLADFPNPNGWNLIHGDVFETERYDEELRAADIVLSNPPFEAFSHVERSRYTSIQETHKPEELLRRLVELPTQPMLGLVLPRRIFDSHHCSQLRRGLASKYDVLETTMLPAGCFQHSSAEPVLLVAYGPTKKANVSLISRYVKPEHLSRFLGRHGVTTESLLERERSRLKAEAVLWLSPLEALWEHLGKYPKLGGMCAVHRGIEWKLPIDANKFLLMSDEERPGFLLGVRSARHLTQYAIKRLTYLNVAVDVARGKAFLQPWAQRKVLLNAHPVGRGPWRLAAAIDRQGLVAYQTVHGIWSTELPLELIAAILNSPLANAYVFSREGKRDVRVRTLQSIPLPRSSSLRTGSARIVRQVRLLENAIALGDDDEMIRALLLDVDASVMDLYDLPPRFERQVLDLFGDVRRPVQIEFLSYLPEDLDMNLTLSEYLSLDLEAASASALRGRVKPVSDPALHRAFDDL